MNKIKVCFWPSDLFGVGHYRSIWIAQEIQKAHSDDFEVDIKMNEIPTDSDVGKYDIHHFHRRIGNPDETVDWIKKFQEAGAIVIGDMDDYWMPFHGHPARDLVIRNKTHVQIVNVNKAADYVTTTTELYKKHIEATVNPNVHIIPNAVDTNMNMWKPRDIKSDKVRIAWIGGSSHEKDLNKLKGTVGKLLSDPEVRDKIQIVMCGYDTRGTVTEINPNTGEEHTRKIKPNESIWNKFEDIFNDNGNASKDQYVRRTTLPITKYGEHYNHCDICLAPLEQHTFNECKSELKIIETGMMGKVLIASDLYAYKELLTHGENAMLVDPKKNHKLWYKYIKQLVLDEELRNKLAKNLYNFVYPVYTLENVTNKRCEWYKEILGR